MSWYNDDVCREYRLRTFPKLVLAREYAKKENIERKKQCKSLLKIWSREVSCAGTRYFVVEDPDVFFDYYITMPEK